MSLKRLDVKVLLFEHFIEQRILPPQLGEFLIDAAYYEAYCIVGYLPPMPQDLSGDFYLTDKAIRDRLSAWCTVEKARTTELDLFSIFGILGEYIPEVKEARADLHSILNVYYSIMTNGTCRHGAILAFNKIPEERRNRLFPWGLFPKSSRIEIRLPSQNAGMFFNVPDSVPQNIDHLLTMLSF